MDCSLFCSDLFRKHNVPRPSCVCEEFDSANHFFFTCPDYSVARERYLPQNLNNYSSRELLHGKPNNMVKSGRSLPPEYRAPTKKRDGYLEWNDYFMAIAFLSSQRSKDPKTQVGACIVNEEKKIVGIGYNGMPNGCHDDVMPWGRESDDVLNTKQLYVCHAELNAVLNKNSADVKNCTVFVALFPCNECAKVIIQSGIKEVVYYSDKYYDRPEFKASKRMFDLAGVKYRQHTPKQKQIVIDFSTIDQMSSGIIADMDSLNLSPNSNSKLAENS